MKKFLIMLITGIILYGNYLNPTPNSNIYLKLYNQAIFDSYIQISNFIQKGIEPKHLRNFDGRIVVAVPADNLPINKIIYYSVIGSKNFFNVETAFDQHSKLNYVIFNAYDREADANYAIKQLNSLNINAVKVYNGEWYRNPLVVKDIINQLKDGALAHFPVKVIKEKEIIYKKIPYPAIASQAQCKPKVITPTVQQCKQLLYKKSIKQTEAKKLKELITLIGHLKKEAIPIVTDAFTGFKWKGKVYTKGDNIKGFTITEAYTKEYIYKCKKYIKVIFKFDDYDKYHLVFRVPLNKIVPNCTIETNRGLIKNKILKTDKKLIIMPLHYNKTPAKNKKQTLKTKKQCDKKEGCFVSKIIKNNNMNKAYKRISNETAKKEQKQVKTDLESTKTASAKFLLKKCDYGNIVSLYSKSFKKPILLINTENRDLIGKKVNTKIYPNDLILNNTYGTFIKVEPQGHNPIYIPEGSLKYCKDTDK